MCSVLSALSLPVSLSKTWKQNILDQRSENQVIIQQNNFFCCAAYRHSSSDEGDLCPWVQVLVDDESTGPLAGPHHATALDQHQQLGRVGQGIWAQVDKSGGFIFCPIHLNMQENTGYHWCTLLLQTPQKYTLSQWCSLIFWTVEYVFLNIISRLFNAFNWQESWGEDRRGGEAGLEPTRLTASLFDISLQQNTTLIIR